MDIRPIHGALCYTVARELEHYGKTEWFAFLIAEAAARQVLGIKRRLYGANQSRTVLALGLAAAIIRDEFSTRTE